MSQAQNRTRPYIVISPAKDEEAHIERTIVSMADQTIRPLKWVIVDDGSRDGTPAVIDRYARQYEWIVPIHVCRDARRKTGSAEILAFNVGYESVRDEDWQFVVKLDTDLELPRDYFERMLARFDEDESLGIASGCHLEGGPGAWQPVKMPPYHAAGASKIVRRKCFLEIGGFPLSLGWDTADEIKARARGWRTMHFPEVEFYHLRPEGTGIGLMRTSMLHGRMYYACGGGALFFGAKFVRRLFYGKPFVGSGLALLAGYVEAAFSGAPRLVSQAEAKSYRKLLYGRIGGALRKPAAE